LKAAVEAEPELPEAAAPVEPVVEPVVPEPLLPQPASSVAAMAQAITRLKTFFLFITILPFSC
jgi:hypothetical protein